mmetsp:Transcript_18404/g.58801  ORF Transcript_18404/g.58801 Transcript_18404/m.58801 type:complete len:211 (+) Transcript_18404:28-660(+)
MVQTRSAAAQRRTLAQVLPWPLYLPNLIGYVRVITMVAAMLESDPGSEKAMWLLLLSLALDYIDGPCARAFDMCTQFGDLLDHYTDHVSMFWLVYITSTSTINVAVNAAHAVVACGYMARCGHYFKHSSGGNYVTRLVEENNYFNMPAMLWNANTVLIPLVKMSYHIEKGLPQKDSTLLINIFDALGGLVTLSYTVAVCLPPDGRSRKGK